MPTIVFVSLCLFLILDAALLYFIAAHKKGLSFASLRRALLWFSLLFAARSFFLPLLWFTAFGLISLLYYDIVIVAPIVAAILLYTRRRAARGLRLFLFAGAVSLPAIGIYASFIETRRLQFERATVPISSERAGKQPIKIALFADIQTTKITAHERRAVDLVMSEEPDIVLIAGDLFQGSDAQLDASLEEFRALLRSLAAPGGVFFVEGDAERDERTARLLQETPVQYLYNQEKKITIKDRQITLLGLELDYAAIGARSASKSFERTDGAQDIRILVSHRPDSIFFLQESSRVDLVLAGHTHGGQVQIPLFGPLLTLSEVPRSVAAGGLHQINKNKIYVSRGLGYEGGQAPPLRFLCPPEVALIVLE